MNFKALLAATAIATAAFAGQASAATALWEFQSDNGGFTNNAWNFGQSFSLGSSATLTALGYYDDGGNGFNGSHDVALYTSAGVLLAQATVSSSDALIGHYRYVNINPVSLAAGTYQIQGASGSDNYTWNTNGFATSAGVTYLGNNWALGSSASFNGGSNNDVSNGYWGANAMLGAGVPEPATWALMIGGFGLAGATLRRRRMVAA